MSEQLADKLNLSKEENTTDFIDVEPMEPATENSEENEPNLDTSSDALLAKMLQNQFNKEYNSELDYHESKINTGHKVITSLKRYRLSVSESSDDSIFSSHEDQDLLEKLEDDSYFEDVG